MKDYIIQWIKHFYEYYQNGTLVFDESNYTSHIPYWTIGLFSCLLIISFLLWWIARSLLVRILHLFAIKSISTWDDHFISNKVFRALAHLLPLGFMDYFLSIVFFNYPNWYKLSQLFIEALIILVVLFSITRTLNAFRDIIKEKDIYKDKPIQSYFQITKIIISGIFIIQLLAKLTNQSPVFFLTSLGAMTAILLLVFKDTILGFVGSIQLAANDMIRIGDWVTMDKYGADGNVVEINLATVKVQNFDKTITTIPTYAFIADSFINWRGMQESDGRRIKRSISIKMDSIHFASDELLNTLAEVKVLSEYIKKTQQEVEEYNRENGFGPEDNINARRQTNIGLFRKYIECYLVNNPEINQEMPLISRQLPPTADGVPIEIYCFTKEKEWKEYERIIADIFDHLFATVASFELEIFEHPSSNDFKKR